MSRNRKGPSRRLGRPTKHSDATIQRLCAALGDGMPIKGACVVAGIGVTTLAACREKYPRLEDRRSEAREVARQKALQAIKVAGDKDWRAYAEWLRLVFGEDYRGPSQNVEVRQAVQVQVSDEQLEDLRRRLAAVRALASGIKEQRENAYEIDVRPSRPELSEGADSALRPPQQAPSTGQASRCREMPRTVAGRSRKGCGYFPSFPLRLTRETC